MIRIIIDKLIPFSLLPIAVYSVQRFSSAPIGNTTIWWLVQALILIAFWSASYFYFEDENKKAFRFLKWYLLWNIFSIVRGTIVAETYWDWKALIGNTFALSLPIIAYTISNKEKLQDIMSFFIKYVLPFSAIVLPFVSPGVWGWYLFPITFLMLFFPIIKLQWKILIIIISLIAMFANIDVRSHTIKYGIPMLLLFFYYTRNYPWSNKMIELTHKALIIIPLLLFLLGVTGIFNIFRMDEYMDFNDKNAKLGISLEKSEEKLTQDSRTFLYKEVLLSAQKNNYWILGRTPARGNETDAFAHIIERGQRLERISNEASILNVFTWTGIIGVILFFLVFYKASWIAINQSRNIYSKLIGLFVAFRWLYAWIEDETWFNMNCFIIWLMIGICFSESFRRMNNAEVKLWARGIFEKRYFLKYREYALNNMNDFS